ncbi:Acyl carrier protein [compost metagenome]|uniref:acyl carrier protein n=1 Tax=Pseudomonas wadenswilerensis TaxID=1785161 RepID=UPI000FAA15E1|nr:acyl carrier protein [Pseudomonas wadenswilerensis]UVM20402.1 acyl carrier protein [Pseudomonas wadenswilerensis]
MSSPLEQQVIAVLMTCLGVDAGQVTREADLVHDLGCDSLNIVEMAEALNECFHQRLDPEAVRHWRCVGDVIRTVQQALQGCLAE